MMLTGIRFTGNGTIRKLTVGADAKMTNSQARTVVQIWRPTNNGQTYTRISEIGPIRPNRIGTDLYEHILSSRVEFQDGDVLGYYQPSSPSRTITLYMDEDFSCGARYYSMGQTVELSGSTASRECPLIAIETGVCVCVCVVCVCVCVCCISLKVHFMHVTVCKALSLHDLLLTEPPGRAQGFVTIDRMKALLSTPFMYNEQGSIQLVFPDIAFNCSGAISSVILGGTVLNGGNDPELQVWTPLGNEVFTKSSKVSLMTPTTIEEGVYEFSVGHQVEFESGDILGLFQPRNHTFFTSFSIGFDSDTLARTVYQIRGDQQPAPHPTTITLADLNVQVTSLLPLISISIGKLIKFKEL